MNYTLKVETVVASGEQISILRGRTILELSSMFVCDRYNNKVGYPLWLLRKYPWELTCEQRRADCDYSAVGALNRCWLCLLLLSGRAAHLPGHSGAQATMVNISLHFSLEPGLLLIEILQTTVSAYCI